MEPLNSNAHAKMEEQHDAVQSRDEGNCVAGILLDTAYSGSKG